MDIVTIPFCLFLLVPPAIEPVYWPRPIIIHFLGVLLLSCSWRLLNAQLLHYMPGNIFHFSSYRGLHHPWNHFFVSFLIASMFIGLVILSDTTSVHAKILNLMPLSSKFIFHHFRLHCFLQKENAMHPPEAPPQKSVDPSILGTANGKVGILAPDDILIPCAWHQKPGLYHFWEIFWGNIASALINSFSLLHSS